VPACRWAPARSASTPTASTSAARPASCAPWRRSWRCWRSSCCPTTRGRRPPARARARRPLRPAAAGRAAPLTPHWRLPTSCAGQRALPTGCPTPAGRMQTVQRWVGSQGPGRGSQGPMDARAQLRRPDRSPLGELACMLPHLSTWAAHTRARDRPQDEPALWIDEWDSEAPWAAWASYNDPVKLIEVRGGLGCSARLIRGGGLPSLVLGTARPLGDFEGCAAAVDAEPRGAGVCAQPRGRGGDRLLTQRLAWAWTGLCRLTWCGPTCPPRAAPPAPAASRQPRPRPARWMHSQPLTGRSTCWSQVGWPC